MSSLGHANSNPHSSQAAGHAEAAYQALLAGYEEDLRRLHGRLAGFQSARRFCLYGTIATLAAAYLLSALTNLFVTSAGILVAVSAVLYHLEIRTEQKADYCRDMARINAQGIARRRRDWDRLPVPKVSAEVAVLPAAVDLDLFGKASLMQLLCTAETEAGLATLARWLVEPCTGGDGPADDSSSPITRRQAAGKMLAPLLGWRQELQRRCKVIGANAPQLEGLLRWGSDPARVVVPAAVRLYAVSLRWLVPTSVAVMFFSGGVGVSMLVGLVAVNVGLTIAFSGRVHTQFRGMLVTPDAPSFYYLSETFAHITSADQLGELDRGIAERCQAAVSALRRLERILALESVARNALSSLLVYLPLQLVLLWDLQVYLAASQWRSTSGQQLTSWFAQLAELEAIASIASLSFEQPQWQFPAMQGPSATPMLVAQGLGHPLLPDDARVTNDVTVGPPGTLLLITGSNMGGKSTLLRAIGMNAALAQAGAPCCCDSLAMSALRVMTSMRVSDSLSDSTSFFVAQLLTLKRIVDQVKADAGRTQAVPVMYLFDEILNGTNTTDRRIAVEGLIGFLLGCRAIGAMTTHDLEIATASRHRDAYRTFYLSHQLGEPGSETELKFDYKLRPGVSPSSNALALFRMLGLPEEPSSR